jgi:hypothetical protein
MEINQEILVDYLDKQLSPDMNAQVARELKEDRQAASALHYLQLAVDTVRQESIREQVAGVRKSFENNLTQTSKKTKGVVYSFYKTSLRIAAVLIFLAGMTFLYKYITVSSQSLYDKQFTAYELSNTRGQADTNTLEEAYENKNWREVGRIYQNETVISNKSAFLAGMAEMQQNQIPQAVSVFENLLARMKTTRDDSFKEETQYYLLLAYLKNNEVNKSLEMINVIKADPNHTYYPMVSRLSTIDLKIIELKK